MKAFKYLLIVVFLYQFGFVYVDADDYGKGTYNRYKKDSFYWYKHVIETNGSEI